MTATSTAGRTRPAAHPRIQARRAAVRRGMGRRRLQRLAELGVVVAVALGFLVALRTPVLDVDRVEVAGVAHTDPSALREALGIQVGDQLADLDIDRAGQAAASLPWVDEVRIHRRLDGVVRVDVTERLPVAVAVSAGGEELLVDAGRRVLGPAAAVPDLAAGLVRVGGTVTVGGIGELLDADLGAALTAAARLGELAPGTVLEVSGDADDLRGVLAEGGEVRLGPPTMFEAKARAVVTVLEQVDLACLAVLDVRAPGSPVLTRDEPCS